MIDFGERHSLEAASATTTATTVAVGAGDRRIADAGAGLPCKR
ncbi:hypothetical protein GLA29479_2391 [Lysobacter antibioticus]|uniref:Uncharacterized protein n=1 Tax=Lysobacter antibioticus TaxID=84531 RepID=A0A0S2FD68_LYSAN|nr:hypothetical protein GLA29479_2391 [Lysobacter antibioticus]ALN81487.1 hypothetical protein LA76x_3360 [Lysobacter antibioticus]